MPFGVDTPFPLYDSIIRKFSGKGPRFDFLAARASVSRSFECYDFNVKAIDTTNTWTVGATSTATTWAVLAEPGGWIRGVTGASVTTGALQISLPQKYFNGTKGAGMAALIRLSAETEVRLECGFADVLPAVGTNCVNLASSSLNSITTGAVYMFDHASGTGTTTALYGIGSSSAVQNTTTSTNRFASGVTLFVAVEVTGRQVKAWAGPPGPPVAVLNNGTTAADAWLPFIAAKTSSGSKNIDIDTIWTWTNGRN